MHVHAHVHLHVHVHVHVLTMDEGVHMAGDAMRCAMVVTWCTTILRTQAFMWLAMEPPTSMTGDAITEAKVS